MNTSRPSTVRGHPPCLAGLPWPVAAIDFEASSLDEDSYPIEVGLALWPAPGESILSWTALIQPAGK